VTIYKSSWKNKEKVKNKKKKEKRKKNPPRITWKYKTPTAQN